MAQFNFPRNLGLPTGISVLRQLNAQAGKNTINLGLGKPEFDMPEELRELGRQHLFENKLDYTENAGDSEVRSLLAEKLSLPSQKNLILTHGAQEALMACFSALLNPGDEVLIPDPGFLAYAPMLRILQAVPVAYSLFLIEGKYQHRSSEIESKITERTRIILLSSPGNPTGVDLSEAFLSELLSFIQNKNLLIVSDEVYGLLHFTQRYQPLACRHPQIISVNSFSKSHALTGWRLGYIASLDSEITQACLIAHQYLATCASVPAQRLLGAMLHSSLFDRIANDFRETYHKKLAIFREAASGQLQAKLPHACGGFYLFPELPDHGNSLSFCERLLKEKDILAIPGSAFGKRGEGSIRLSLALPDSQIRKAAQEISQYYLE